MFGFELVELEDKQKGSFILVNKLETVSENPHLEWYVFIWVIVAKLTFTKVQERFLSPTERFRGYSDEPGVRLFVRPSVNIFVATQ